MILLLFLLTFNINLLITFAVQFKIAILINNDKK